MQIPINTAPLKALDVPTRWLLVRALERAEYAASTLARNHRSPLAGQGPEAKATAEELEREADVYRQIAEAIRD